MGEKLFFFFFLTNEVIVLSFCLTFQFENPSRNNKDQIKKLFFY